MYAKLFASLYEGTLRGCADEILVFTNMLAYADMHGIVDRHFRVIAEDVGISRERVLAAITNLEAPDPESRSPEEEGRRIVKLDDHRIWGWRIVNHGRYTAIRHAGDRRAQNREAQERYRLRKQSKQSKPGSAHIDTDTDTDTDIDKERSPPTEVSQHHAKSGTRLPPTWRPNDAGRSFAADLGLDPDSTADAFADYWTAASGRTATKRDWNAAFRTWCRLDRGVGSASARAIQAPRGHGAFYDELALIARKDRERGGNGT